MMMWEVSPVIGSRMSILKERKNDETGLRCRIISRTKKTRNDMTKMKTTKKKKKKKDMDRWINISINKKKVSGR